MIKWAFLLKRMRNKLNQMWNSSTVQNPIFKDNCIRWSVSSKHYDKTQRCCFEVFYTKNISFKPNSMSISLKMLKFSVNLLIKHCYIKSLLVFHHAATSKTSNTNCLVALFTFKVCWYPIVKQRLRYQKQIALLHCSY